MSLIKKNILNIIDELEQNNSQKDSKVRLVAVSKGQGQEKILEALKSGHNILVKITFKKLLINKKVLQIIKLNGILSDQYKVTNVN